MEREIAGGTFGEYGKRAQTVNGTHATEESGRAREAFDRDTVINHVHNTAQDTRAIEQGRRTAEHLDFADRQRIDAHRMIRTRAGRIEAARTVLGDLESIAFEPTNHWAA